MSLPEGYSLRQSNADHDEHPDWTLVEHVCMQTDEVYVDPYQYHIGTLIDGPDGDTVGAMWYSFEHKKAFSFHLATSPEHRDIGLGSFMMDEAARIYRQRKQENPSLQAEVFLVAPKVMQGLFNRGFCVSSIVSLEEENFALEMQEAPPLVTFLQSAIKSDSAKFFRALDSSVMADGVPAKDWPASVKSWFERPRVVDAQTQAAMEQLVLALPLPEMDLRYVWSQLQNHVASKNPFPRPLLQNTTPDLEQTPTPAPEREGFRIHPR